MSDTHHIDEVIKKGNRIIAYIKSIINGQDDFNRIFYGDVLWKTIGLPTINYACSVWFTNSKASLDRIENLQYQVARYLLKSPRNVAKEALYGDLGWNSVESIQMNIRVTYFSRLKNMGDNRWPRLLFRAIFELMDVSKWQWLKNVKKCLDNCNLSENFNSNSTISLSKTFKQRNKIYDTSNWFDRAQTKSSLKDYIRYKSEPTLEPYLLDKGNFTGVTLKFKARSNSLDLEGRKESWSNLNTGLCKLCNNGSKESVDHFVFECCKFNSIRESIYQNLNNELNMHNLEVFWDMFISGFSNFRHHLFFDDLNIHNKFPLNPNLLESDYQEASIIFDKYCKKYLYIAWMKRIELYKDM